MKPTQLWITLTALTLLFTAGCGGSSYSGDSSNTAPVAVAGGPYNGTVGQAVLFNGSASSDADGNPLTYDWNFGDGSSGTGVTPSHVYAATGTYAVTLRVYDGQDYSATVNSSAVIAAAGGISGTGIAKGIISGFGSVIVGGTHYNVTGTTSITVDDNPSAEDQLEVGYYVEIESSFDDNDVYTAGTIVAAESVEGPVSLAASTIEAADTGVLSVMGQTVRVTPGTILDNTDFGPGGLNELADGDYLEVHGLTRNDGSVDASHVERKTPLPTDQIEVTGKITSATPASDRFTINGLTVTYTLGVLRDFGGREPALGDLVEVKGTPAGLTAGPTLAATSVELKTATFLGSSGDRGEVEGYIENCSGTPCSSFMINTVIVNLAASVIYEPAGLNQSDLTNNIKIEAEGSFNDSGVLIANRIEFKTDNNSRIEATVDSNTGTALVLLGVTVNYDANTDYDDNVGGAALITQVAPGDYVEARGDEDPSGNNVVLASEVKREDPPGDGRMIIRGIADSVAGQTVSVLGVDILITGSTQCRNLDDQAYSGGCSAFLTGLNQGLTTVKARGVSFAGGVLTAEEIELEN